MGAQIGWYISSRGENRLETDGKACLFCLASRLSCELSGNSDYFRTVLVQGNSDVFPHVGSLPVENERVVHLKLAKTDMFVRRAAAFCTFVTTTEKVQAHHGSTSI